MIQGDQNVSVNLMITVPETRKNVLNSFSHMITYLELRIKDGVSVNVSKYLETGAGHFEHYL
jgi:hypothetical protein